MRTPVKNFWILPGGLQVSKQLKWVGVVIGVQLKRHDFEQWESFRCLVDKDVPFESEVWCGYWGRRFGLYKPRKTTNFGDRRTTLLHGSFWAYIAVHPQMHCNPFSSLLIQFIAKFFRHCSSATQTDEKCESETIAETALPARQRPTAAEVEKFRQSYVWVATW